jgi:hypothetical protein
MAIFCRNVGQYWTMLLSGTQIALIAGFAALCFISYDRRSYLAKNILRQWNLLVPSVAAFALFSTISVETRYVGAFMVLLWLGLYSGVRATYSRRGRILQTGIVIAAATVIACSIIKSTLPATAALARKAIKGEDYFVDALGARPAIMGQTRVAEGLARMGVRPHDNVASIGRGFLCGWARLAKVRIIAEVTDGSPVRPATQDVEDFWAADPSIRRKVVTTFERTGAKAIVADQAPAWAVQEGWRHIADTPYYAYLLPR